MEYFSLSLIILLPTLLLLLLLLLHHHFRRRVNHHLPPGNYGLPIIGETLQLISAYKSDNPDPFIQKRMSRFGPVFSTHIFGEPTVFTADPEVNRFVLQNEGRLFQCSYPASIANLLGKNSLLIMKGCMHKRMHAITMRFGNGCMIRDHLLVDIDRLVRSFLGSWTLPDRVFLMEEAKKVTFALTVKQLMSFDPCEWTENLRKHYLLLIDGFFSLPLPFFSTTYNRAIKARTKVAEALILVVRERRKANERERKNDILEALLDEEARGGGGGECFSDDMVVDFLLSLLVAGYETTSTSITLAIKFLTETPLALAQLKKEQESIRAKKGESEVLDWSDYKSMTFTQCVINETLRMANIISGVFRETTTDVNVRGYTIPKGWKVFASFRAVHMNDDYFKDARSFNPWRWQNVNGVTCPTGMFTPFGGGPRLCPGYELTRVTLSIFLHHFVTKFSWKPIGEDKLMYFPTTRTRKRYPIYVQRRRNTDI